MGHTCGGEADVTHSLTYKYAWDSTCFSPRSLSSFFSLFVSLSLFPPLFCCLLFSLSFCFVFFRCFFIPFLFHVVFLFISDLVLFSYYPSCFFSSPSFSCFHSRSFSCFSSLISIFLLHFPDLFSLISQFLLFFISCLLLPHFPVFLYFPFSSPSLSNFSSSPFLVFYSP